MWTGGDGSKRRKFCFLLLSKSGNFDSVRSTCSVHVSNQLAVPHQAHGAQILGSAPSKPWLAESGWHRARLVPASDPARPKLSAPGRQVAKSPHRYRRAALRPLAPSSGGAAGGSVGPRGTCRYLVAGAGNQINDPTCSCMHRCRSRQFLVAPAPARPALDFIQSGGIRSACDGHQPMLAASKRTEKTGPQRHASVLSSSDALWLLCALHRYQCTRQRYAALVVAPPRASDEALLLLRLQPCMRRCSREIGPTATRHGRPGDGIGLGWLGLYSMDWMGLDWIPASIPAWPAMPGLI